MLTFALHITVKPGHERAALDTLSAIEQGSRKDIGCLQFTWFQHEADPYRFTLFEQWESKEHLDAHLAKNPELWERFVPALAAEPVSEQLRPVRAVAGLPEADELRSFVLEWFDKLSNRAPVEELLRMVAAAGLEMEFPEATLTNEAEFRTWYADVGKAFGDQSHELERLRFSSVPDGNAIDIELTVIWRARRLADGADLAFRARQSWRVARSFVTGAPMIITYRVHGLEDIAARRIEVTS